jgi:parallel beta-helix repeat protein
MAMRSKTVIAALIISAFLISLVAGMQIDIAKANFLIPPNSLPTIYIRSDGSIEPSSAPIQQENKVYTLTSNLTGITLEVQCDNIIVDGAGYTLSSDNKSSPAILLRGRYNVTVENFQVNSFCMMYIRVEGCTGCTITANTVVTYQGGAIVLNGCKNITITNNTIYNADTTIDGKGTTVYIGGDYHIVSGNQLFGGVTGINVYGKQNTIANNTLVNVIKNPIYIQGNFTNTVENNTLINLPTEPASPSPAQTSTPTITSSPSTSPSPESTPQNSPTQQPTLEPSPTLDNIQAEDYTPIAIIVGLVIAVIAVMGVVLIYLKKRRG